MLRLMNHSNVRALPTKAFETQFTRLADNLALSSWLSAENLRRLCEAAFYARLCNISFNGLGGCGGHVKPEREANRIILEQEFMAACATFWASSAVQTIPHGLRTRIRGVFLNVSVAEENLAS